MIRKHANFPKGQVPELSFRIGDSRPECIHIARMTQEEDSPPSTPIEDVRHQEYLDIRLHFSSELTYQKIFETCDALKVLKTKDSMFARHIHTLERTVWHHISKRQPKCSPICTSGDSKHATPAQGQGQGQSQHRRVSRD